ncbi:MAG: MlaD family protein [Mariniblastus sp.]
MNKSDKAESNSDSNLQTNLSSEIPTAIVQPSRIGLRDLLKGSYMWLVALACLAVAIGVVWWSIPEQGIQITIHFPEGHGLKAEDSVRFRGIDVGIVDEVKLNEELSTVDVSVNLLPFAEPLAREGTRFWIVRPELSVGGISGLETAVGHKYIGLIPGNPDGDWQTVFDGLTNSPPDVFENEGIEIIVRGEKKDSVATGSPVSFRGVIVGRVLSVGLSQDGRFVDARLRIFKKYTKFVTTETKFWANSGIDLDFKAIPASFRFEMESVETLLQGGVSLLTISSGGKQIQPGDDFTLHSSPKDEWFEQAKQVQATGVDTQRGAIPMLAQWTNDGMIYDTTKTEFFTGTLVEVNGTQRFLVPSDLLVEPTKAVKGTLKIGLAENEKTYVAVSELAPTESKLRLFDFPAESIAGVELTRPFSAAETREPTDPERCIAVRAKGATGEIKYFHQAIEKSDIGEGWMINNFNGDRSVWHGAAVLSIADEKLIGVLLIDDRETRIEPITETMLKSN